MARKIAYWCVPIWERQERSKRGRKRDGERKRKRTAEIQRMTEFKRCKKGKNKQCRNNYNWWHSKMMSFSQNAVNLDFLWLCIPKCCGQSTHLTPILEIPPLLTKNLDQLSYSSYICTRELFPKCSECMFMLDCAFFILPSFMMWFSTCLWRASVRSNKLKISPWADHSKSVTETSMGQKLQTGAQKFLP